MQFVVSNFRKVFVKFTSPSNSKYSYNDTIKQKITKKRKQKIQEIFDFNTKVNRFAGPSFSISQFIDGNERHLKFIEHEMRYTRGKERGTISNAEIYWTHKLSKHGVHKQHDSIFFSCTNPLKLNTYCVYARLHTGVLVFTLCFPYSFRSSFCQFHFICWANLSQFNKIKNNWIKWSDCWSGVLKWRF